MMDYESTWNWGLWLVMITSMLAAWALIVAAGLVGIRFWQRPTQHPLPEDPHAILDKRFARGELSEDEYLRAQSLLGQLSGQESRLGA